MILINLLPHRELARKRAKDAYNMMLVLAAIVGVLIAGGIRLSYQIAIDRQQSRNAFLTAENARLDTEIKDVADLQTNRNLPVHLLNDTVRMLPEGMYLNGIKQDGQNILLTGVAQSQGRVSDLLRNLSASSSQWLNNPQLIEIKADQLALSPRDQRRVYDFTVRVLLGQPDEAASTQRAATKTKGGA